MKSSLFPAESKIHTYQTITKLGAFLDSKKFPKKSAVLIYDEYLLKFETCKKLIDSFALKYAVRAGEDLKDIQNFAKHMNSIFEITKDTSPKNLMFVALGGGSVGDFTGFIASVFKRGVAWSQIPTTWLAAIDSSHGGKTALNIGKYKNQIGSFYCAEQIFIIKEILFLQTPERAHEANGELIKMALLDKSIWAKNFWAAKKSTKNQNDPEYLWKNLLPAIQAKLKFVKKDFREKTGLRSQLNLGHTFAHILELEYALPHGLAVLYGLEFALNWSMNSKRLKANLHLIYTNKINEILKLYPRPPKIQKTRLESLILQDKKRTGSKSNTPQVLYIFIKKASQVDPQIIQVQDFIQEAIRQNWVAE